MQNSDSKIKTKPKVLGVVTARGGSKGIPGKNIKPLLGKPLITYTLDAAKRSRVLDRLVVSTDDPAIAAVAQAHGAEVPFLRPAKLAADDTPHLSVLQHAVQWLQDQEHYSPDYVMILQPTSPLRQAFHIQEAVESLVRHGADSLVSVAKIPENFNPHKAMILTEDNKLRLLTGDPVARRIARRQDLPQTYWSVGAIYLFKTALLFDPVTPTFYGDRVIPYFIDAKYIVDINVPEDWENAERALQRLQRDQGR